MDIHNGVLVVGAPGSGKTCYIESLLSGNIISDVNDLIWVSNEMIMPPIRRIDHKRCFGKNFGGIISYFRIYSPSDVDEVYCMIRKRHEQVYSRYKCIVVFDDLPLYHDDMEHKVMNFMYMSQKYGGSTIISVRSSQWCFMSLLKYAVEGIVLFQMPMALISHIIEGLNVNIPLLYTLYDDVILKANSYLHILIDCKDCKTMHLCRGGCGCYRKKYGILERDSEKNKQSVAIDYPSIKSVIRLTRENEDKKRI